jgi:hypothetical protein
MENQGDRPTGTKVFLKTARALDGIQSKNRFIDVYPIV